MDDDDNVPQSEDNALEPADDIYNPDVDEERLDEDGDPPATPSARNLHHLPPDHPELDTDIDIDELYNEGPGEATGVDDEEILPEDIAEPLEPED